MLIPSSTKQTEPNNTFYVNASARLCRDTRRDVIPKMLQLAIQLEWITIYGNVVYEIGLVIASLS